MKEKHYKAFISYSHKDEKFATWLHQELEHYQIPQEVQKEYPLIPTSLYPIFRDRYELNAGDDLNIEISQALTNSDALIIICSTQSANSQWVNKEIMEFKAKHGEDKIFPIILNGEPFAKENSKFDDSLECFPEALKYTLSIKGELTTYRAKEIVASSIKPNDDGEELATLKLIAGLLNIPFGEFYRRDILFKEERLEKLKKQKEEIEKVEYKATRAKRAVFDGLWNDDTLAINYSLIQEFGNIIFDKNWKDSESSPSSRFNFFRDTPKENNPIPIEFEQLVIDAYLFDIKTKIKNYQYDEAEDIFIKIYEKNPLNIELLNNYSYFLGTKRNKYSLAINLYQNILNIDLDDENSKGNIRYLHQVKKYFNFIELFNLKINSIIFFKKFRNKDYKLNKDKYSHFIDNISLLLYFLAFGREALYKKTLFIECIPKNNGKDIVLKIEGTQDKKKLYVYAIVEIRERQVIKILWKEQNGILVPQIDKNIIDRILKECTEEYLWTRTYQKWTNDTLEKERDRLIRKRLFQAIENSFFFDSDLNRKERWLDVVAEIELDSIQELIFAIKRENIRFLKKKRVLSEELDTSRYKDAMAKFADFTSTFGDTSKIS